MLTVPQLIDMALKSCAGFDCYRGPQGRVRFAKDQNSLVKAIMRFGYVCHQRGWDFDAAEIVTPIMNVIRSVKDREKEIRIYLPIYLERAIDMHVRMKAEEYNACAKSKKIVVSVVTRAIHGTTKVEAIREPSHTELCAAAYGDRKHVIRQNLKRAKAAPRKIEQPMLL